jgi:hypothetical protein
VLCDKFFLLVPEILIPARAPSDLVVYAQNLGNQWQLSGGDISAVTGRKWPAVILNDS